MDYDQKKRKKRFDRELEERKFYRRKCAKENGYNPNYCSSRVKRFSPAEIAEYQRSLEKKP